MAVNTAELSLKYDTDNDAIISLRNVSMQYAEENGFVMALQNVNLDIYKGEFVCVTGPSGCGKSTLLNIAAGFHKPTKGTAVMYGKKIEGPDRRRGVVFHTPTISQWLNIHDNIEFVIRRRINEKDKIAEMTEFYLKLAGLEDLEAQKPYTISDIMRHRASLVRVLANEPEIIIMDEPFVTLNSDEREKMQDFVREIQKKTGVAVLYVANNVDEALSLATRIIVMSACPGQILGEFRAQFTREISVGNRKGVISSKEYVEMREEILDIINTKNTVNLTEKV